MAVFQLVLIVTVLVAAVPTAFAQQGASGGVSEPATEDVVVTAQRREEKLEDVGISVTVLDSTTLTNLNITKATDISRAVPGLKVNAYSSSQVVFNIRGVSQNDYGDQQEPPVAVYQDDSYSSSINLASFPVFDLERVETLRGPQGTLFGRNATGGAIQFISRKPTREFEGYASLIVGSFNQVITEGAISGPLSDRLQVRLATIRNADDGYIKSVVPGVDDRGSNNHYAVRGQVGWQPAENTDVNLNLRYMKADQETQAGLYSHEPACPNGHFQGEFTPADVNCDFWFPPPYNPPSYVPLPGASGTGYRNDAIIPSRGGDPWATAETQPSYVDREILGGTLHVGIDLGRVHLLSITDVQDADKFYLEGGDASPDEGVLFDQGSDLRQWSEEVHLSGQSGAHRWVAGLHAMKADGDYTGKFADPFYGYDPTVAMAQKTMSYAVFSQDEWRFGDTWRLNAGLRYWNDKREGSYFGFAPEVPGLSAPVTIIFNENEISPLGSSVTPDAAKRTFDGLKARLQLDWKPSNRMLLYASYNRGSNSGGFTFSTGTPYDPDGSQTVPREFLAGLSFDPEELNAYELGMKATLGPATTLHLSAFHYDYSGYQAFAQYGQIQTVINLDATETGLEAELRSRPLDGLTLQLGASLLDSTVKDVLLPDQVTVEDHDLPQAPGVSGNALARYEFGVGAGRLGLQADAQYSSDFCFTVLCAPVEEEPAYIVANARITYQAPTGRWDLAVFVDNLFEEAYRVYAFDSSLFSGVVAGVYAKPRTWGVRATSRVGKGY